MQLAPFHQNRVLAIVGPLWSLIVASTHLTACVGAPDPEEDVGTTLEAEETVNGLTMNGLTTNGLTMNGLTTNGLTMNGLTLTSGVTSTLNSDPLARLFFSYVVNCALPTGQNVVFPTLAGQTNYTFYGGLGAAPQWGVDGGSCGLSCQQWVSACVLSRVNALGVHIPLSVRGNNAALAVETTERSVYPHREATYFGNILGTTQERYACRTATDDQTLIGRPCGNGADVTGCIITVLGNCDTVCSTKNATDGYYANCTAPTSTIFSPAVTVYRQ